MKVLVIPDVHLKPKMFTRAMAIMEYGVAERAVCLMDIADDWNQQSNIALYEETYDAAIRLGVNMSRGMSRGTVLVVAFCSRCQWVSIRTVPIDTFAY